MGAVTEYKCLNCKAGLRFDPPSQKWKCGYCFSEFDKEQLDAAPIEEGLPNQDMPELDSYRCTSCGAELIADDTVSATTCLYCKSPTIIKSRVSGRFKPQSLIPFRLTKAEAEELYKNWIRSRRFAPKEFKDQETVHQVTGIYAPYWLFDCTVHGNLEGEATRVRHWQDGDYRYTETKYYRVVRRGHVSYDRLPVDASKKLDDKWMYKIEPYDYADLTDFAMPYMSGFMAEKYDVEAQEAEQTLQKRVEGYAEERLRETVNGYASYHVRDKQIDITDKSYSYALLPVYVLINQYKGKEHIFMVNGQTGKVVGDTPVSFLKQLAFAGSVFAIAWFLAVFGGALFV